MPSLQSHPQKHSPWRYRPLWNTSCLSPHWVPYSPTRSCTRVKGLPWVLLDYLCIFHHESTLKGKGTDHPGSNSGSPTYQLHDYLVVQSLSHIQLFVTLWTAAHQPSLSFTTSWNLLKFLSIELVMPSNYLILCHPPSPPTFNLSQYQGHCQWVGSLHQIAKVLELQLQLQHQSFQLIFRVDFLPCLMPQFPL